MADLHFTMSLNPDYVDLLALKEIGMRSIIDDAYHAAFDQIIQRLLDKTKPAFTSKAGDL